MCIRDSRQAIHAIGRSGNFAGGDVFVAPSISVKLSALHPRYEHAKRARVFAELGPRLLDCLLYTSRCV